MDKKFENFLEVLQECDIKNKDDYATFMSVVKEHCLEKGINDYETIKNTWLAFKASLHNMVVEIKTGKERLTGN